MDKDWTLPENLAELKRLAERATPGPWEVDKSLPLRPLIRVHYGGLRGYEIVAEANDVLKDADDNAVFIAVTREAVPQLIAVLEKERK